LPGLPSGPAALTAGRPAPRVEARPPSLTIQPARKTTMSAPQAQGVGDETIDAPPVDRRRRLELLEDCRELVLSRLGRVVAEALAGISDELTELALRETRRDAQQALLDAVSLVRRHRPEIELRFHDAFSEIFERRMRGES